MKVLDKTRHPFGSSTIQRIRRIRHAWEDMDHRTTLPGRYQDRTMGMVRRHLRYTKGSMQSVISGFSCEDILMRF